MVIRLRTFTWVAIWVCALASGALRAAGQNTSSDVPPAIDVYAMGESFPGIRPMCPNEERFLASDPKGSEAAFGLDTEDCTPKLYPAAKGEYLNEMKAEMSG